MDGDGKLDLAVANGTSNTVSVFRNTSIGAGNISFAPKIDLVAGTFPFCVAIGDFDGDGKPDLASTSSGNTVSVFKNNSVPGSFSFWSRSDFATGNSPFWIAIGDLDNDGKPELATANGSENNSVSVLRNTSTPGSISFAGKADFDGGGYSYSIMIADVDGDSKPDLTVAGEGNFAAVLLNTSAGTANISFRHRTILSTGSSSFGVTLSDMDGDNKPDIIVANTSSNSVSVLKNRSNPGFLFFDQYRDFIVGRAPWVATAVDLNGDGKPEIATANHRSANISVLKSAVSLLGIQSFTPVSAGSGTAVTVNGFNFAGITGVSFGGVPAASFTVSSPEIISAIVGAGASGSVTITTNNDTASLAGFTLIPAPTITAFTPTTAGSGDTVTITGTNFTGATAVHFGSGQASSFIVVSSTTIKAVVELATSGAVSVATNGGTALLNGFIYDNTPSITSVLPAAAATGDTVTINGIHFTGTSSVRFGGIPATSFTIVSSKIIRAIVGAGASGNLTVTNGAGTANFSGFTYYPPPLITSFTPGLAGPLESVTITGNNFVDVTEVTFGEIPASSYTVNSATSILAVVAGGSSGDVKVKTRGGTDSLAGFTYNFAPIPIINSFSPVTGPIESTVTISGNNFSPVNLNNVVYFGAVRALVLTASTTSLTVKVPRGATYQPISVTTDKNLTAYSSQPFITTFVENVTEFTSNSFAPKVDFITGTFSRFVVMNDLDGDNKNDLVVANGVAGTISILKNISSDSVPIFDSKIDYNTNNAPIHISAGDLDGDGLADLVITNNNSGGASDIQVFRNISTNGSILFAPALMFATGAGSIGTDIGDFDGDGKPEVVVTSSNSGIFSIFRNVSTVGKIAFAARMDSLFYRGDNINRRPGW